MAPVIHPPCQGGVGSKTGATSGHRGTGPGPFQAAGSEGAEAEGSAGAGGSEGAIRWMGRPNQSMSSPSPWRFAFTPSSSRAHSIKSPPSSTVAKSRAVKPPRTTQIPSTADRMNPPPKSPQRAGRVSPKTKLSVSMDFQPQAPPTDVTWSRVRPRMALPKPSRYNPKAGCWLRSHGLGENRRCIVRFQVRSLLLELQTLQDLLQALPTGLAGFFVFWAPGRIFAGPHEAVPRSLVNHRFVDFTGLFHE